MAFVGHEPCPSEACDSSDAFARYEDGGGKCFSCGHVERAGGASSAPPRSEPGRPPMIAGEAGPLPKRGLHGDTCAKFSYLVGSDQGRPCHIATYYDASGRPVAQKLRYQDKSFRWTGNPKAAGLFGQQLWGPGKRVVVTEGEIDALSVSQVQGNRWPVVSVPNGAQGARRDLQGHIEFLESFGEIVLMFDNDAPGEKAAAECAELFTPGKVKIAKLPKKDPNDMLLAGSVKELVSAIWNAKAWRPDGVVSGASLWDEVNKPIEWGLHYPWPRLDKMVYGQRGGEIVTWGAGTGIGKSRFVQEITHHLHSGGECVGVIALEESVRRAALQQMAIDLRRPLHLPGQLEQVEKAELRAAFDRAVGTDRLHFYDHFGSVEATSLLPKIRYMVIALGCRWIVLDHISIMISGTATEGDERKRIDELMTKLRTLVEELRFGLHLVSHLRKASGTPHEEGGRVTLDDFRGSGAIKQVSDIIVGLERDQQCPKDKNRTHLRVLKNRYAGLTGEADDVLYVPETGALEIVEPVLGPVEQPVLAERITQRDF